MRISVIAVFSLVVGGAVLAVRTQPADAPLSESALRTRLVAYAHDSMRGRRAGTADNDRATAYIAGEFRKLGLEPAGENGSFFQTVPLRTLLLPDSAFAIMVAGRRLRTMEDYVPRLNGKDSVAFDATATVFGGVWGDTAKLLDGERAANKVVIIALPAGQAAVVKAQLESRFARAAAVAVANLDAMSPAVRELLGSAPWPATTPVAGATTRRPAYLHITDRLATELLGGSPERIATGAAGASIGGGFRFVARTFTARNVIAILRGTDASMRNSYVAIGSHNDHEGVGAPVDADSLRAFNLEFRRLQVSGSLSPQSIASIRVNMDSVRRVHPAPRLDSIFNGADDDGSGTVAMLEIARAMSPASARPRRSILFVSHTAEEDGLVGSTWFTEHPTVALDSIIAHVNIDMIGRGGVLDESGGGSAYLQLIGTRRLSTQLGDLVEHVSASKGYRWNLDYTFDKPGHPEQLYCRSDHFSYARFGIPVAFISTGIHADYHQVTDEAERIDYSKLSRTASFVKDLLSELANGTGRPILDKPKPDPAAPCVH